MTSRRGGRYISDVVGRRSSSSGEAIHHSAQKEKFYRFVIFLAVILAGSAGLGLGQSQSRFLSSWEVQEDLDQFQKDGRLFDSRGVEPDVYFEPSPGYYLAGGRDEALELAVKDIESRFKKSSKIGY